MDLGGIGRIGNIARNLSKSLAKLALFLIISLCNESQALHRTVCLISGYKYEFP